MLARWIGIIVLVVVVVAMVFLGVVYGPALGLTAAVAPPNASGSPSASGPGQASQANPRYVTIEQYQRERDEDLKLIEGNTQAIADNQQAMEDKAEQIAANQEAIRANSDSIAAVRTQSNDLVAVQDDLNNTLEQITGRDASGTPFPNVLSIMASPDGRQQMEEAVHDSMRDRGTLVVENRMSQGYTLMVNDASHYVPPGQTVRVEGLPVGTVETELVGHESPKNWSLGPPNYEQRITIGRRPPRTVYYEAPVVRRTYYLDTGTVYYPPAWIW
jgi:hypothetical protein